MKSKTFFFNKAIYRKNMTLYWPIWVCYLLYGLVKVPGRLWFGLQSYGEEAGASYQALADCLNLQIDIVVIAVCAVVCGMAVFGYLFSTRSAYMIHALPVTRRELFFTNVLSGLGFLFVPQVVVFFVTVLLCLSKGITCVQYVGIWLLSVLGISLFLFSVVSFCAMLVGLLFALPVFFGLVNYLALGCTLGVRLLLAQLGYGISYNDTPDILFLRILSPIDYMIGAISLLARSRYDSNGDLIAGLCYSGGRAVAGYALASVVVYALAYYCYTRRRSESAGDLLAFSWMKPVFRCIAGIGVGYTAAIVTNSFFPGIPIWVMVVVFGLLAFFVADMFVQKSFRVFTRRRFRECAVFLGCVAVSYGGVYGAAYGVEHYVPDESQLKSAYLYMNYPVEFQGGQIGDVLAIHEGILEHGREMEALAASDDTEEVLTISLIYHFKNGKKLERLYQLPSGDAFCENLAETLYGYESEPDSFMKYLVGMDYDRITEFEEAQVEYDSENDEYVGHTLSAADSAKVYRALCEDARAGTLQKYSLRGFGEQEESDMYIYFEFYHTSEDWEDVFDVANGSRFSENFIGATGEEDSAVGYLSISFGEDCENLIAALRDAGAFEE
jgi:ABC-2 type transport system permease protein